MPDCTHLNEIHDVRPDAKGCSECLAAGDRWVHLRECLVCGHVACCDSSRNRHARRHYERTGHAIIQSFEPGEDWRWCYIDEAFLPAGGASH
ncbi:MAG TPA: UBP-type zinc finger domain-containing protein [Anaeromyxobacteraceae bacterium]|nr:UBP-type zinc finger domain-containing protein [Anaeromyxobacteraceae bacterium]